jgi:hypothetical protein
LICIDELSVKDVDRTAQNRTKAAESRKAKHWIIRIKNRISGALGLETASLGANRSEYCMLGFDFWLFSIIIFPAALN